MTASRRLSRLRSLPKRSLAIVACTVAGVLAGYLLGGSGRVAAREPVSIAEAGIGFTARLDTGATISSINAHEIEVIGGSSPADSGDTGKLIRFTVENAEGEKARVETTIEQVRGIRTSDCHELRYHVYLTVVHEGTRYKLLMNLNDRSESKDKLLLGRNWLQHGFAVDITKDALNKS